MAHAHVPKFGNWGAGDTPYTQYFDNARKDRMAGKMVNPNDPYENPEAFSENSKESPHQRNKIGYVGNDTRTHNSPFERPGSKTPPRDPRGRVAKTSAGTVSVGETSPIHSPHQGKSPKSRGSSKGNTGRSKARSRDESAQKSSTVPIFGGWDPNDPSSADGFTDIFNELKQERRTGSSARSPIIRKEVPYGQPEGSNSACCSWLPFCK